MTLSQYSKRRLADDFNESFNAMLSELFETTMGLPAAVRSEAAWSPPVDIYEAGEGYVIAVDLPGVMANDVEIYVENGVLILKGKRDLEDHEKRLRVERARGSFLRRFSLPEAVNVDGIKAESKDGVFSISLPKQAVVKPKKISVQVAA